MKNPTAEQMEVRRGKTSKNTAKKSEKRYTKYTDVRLTKRDKAHLETLNYDDASVCEWLVNTVESDGMSVRVMPQEELKCVRVDVWDNTDAYEERSYLVARHGSVFHALQSAAYAYVEIYEGLPPRDDDFVDW